MVLDFSHEVWVFWGHKIWKKIFVVLLTRSLFSARNSTCQKVDEDFSKKIWTSRIIQTLIYQKVKLISGEECFLFVCLSVFTSYLLNIFHRNLKNHGWINSRWLFSGTCTFTKYFWSIHTKERNLSEKNIGFLVLKNNARISLSLPIKVRIFWENHKILSGRFFRILWPS